MDKRVFLIVILGGTGTGKSKLAIQIAKKLGSEIISADSMQVYKGLDILTNKVTPKERSEVPHHLIDFVQPLINFTVVNFRDKSLPIIDGLFKHGKSPVVVGGTNYYIESILWRTLVDSNKTKNENEFFDDDRNELLSQVCEKLFGIPISKGTKRKADELNISPTEKYKFLNAPHKLSVFDTYCCKILASIRDVIINHQSDVAISIFDDLITNESMNDIDAKIEVLKENFNDCKHTSTNETLFGSLKFCLSLKNNINFVISNLKNHCNNLEDGNNLLNDHVIKKYNLDPALCSINDSVLEFYKHVERYIPQDINILKKELELHINLSCLSSDPYKLLKFVDPERAAFLHPNDKRKILRSLEVWAATGRKHSDIILEQQNEGSALGGPLRFNNAIIFWLTAEPEILNKRLDDRVYQMLDQGLVEELLDFYSRYQPKEEDFTKGIFQSIGFKEFREFLLLSDEEKSSEIGKKKLNDGIETLKLVTRRYVRFQNKWIKNRFLRCPDRDVPPVYNLDTSNVERWDELVFKPAMDVIVSKIEGTASSLKPLKNECEITKEEMSSLKTGEFYCHDCKRLFIGSLQWNVHMSSKKHKKVVKRNKQLNVSEDNNFESNSSGGLSITSLS